MGEGREEGFSGDSTLTCILNDFSCSGLRPVFEVTLESSWLIQLMGSESHSLLSIFFLPRRDYGMVQLCHLHEHQEVAWRELEVGDLMVGTAVYFGRVAWIGAKILTVLTTDFKGNLSTS